MLHHAVRIRLMIILILTWILRVENWLRNCIFCKVHVCDLLWPSGSPQVTGHGVRWKAVYEFLSINNCNTKPIWHHYWDIDMQHFCNHCYIFEKCFSPKLLFAYCWPFFKLYLKSLTQTLTEKMRFSQNSCMWPFRSPHDTGHLAKWKALYEFLSMNNCKHRLIWKRCWDIHMQHFCNPWLHFEWRFSRIFSRNESFLWLGSLEIMWRIILLFTWSL